MKSKPLPVAVLLALVVAGALLAPSPSGGQTGEEIQMTQIVNDITTQQATIVDNQAKIDAKLASVAENIRQARIYAGRGK